MELLIYSVFSVVVPVKSPEIEASKGMLDTFVSQLLILSQQPGRTCNMRVQIARQTCPTAGPLPLIVWPESKSKSKSKSKEITTYLASKNHTAGLLS
jgi:hypothetical protein